MLTIKTTLKPSSIHGLGVFADEPVKKGQVISRPEYFLDLILTENELLRLPEIAQEYILHYGHISKHAKGSIILDFGNERYMNHSDTPNTDFRADIGVALHDIAVGEEITYNYHDLEDETSPLQPPYKKKLLNK